MSSLRFVRASSLVIFGAACFALAACDNPNPGTPLGTFAVTSALTANSCGSDVAAPDPGSFGVTLSNDQGVVYWFPDTGGSSASGGLSASHSVSISEVVADSVGATTDGGASPCTLERADTLSFTLSSATSPSSFSGSYDFTVSALSGSSCTSQLASAGGGYVQLPCTVTYSMTGTRQ